MTSNTQESSNVLRDRKLYPDRISSIELEALKMAIAEQENYPRLENDTFDKVSDGWIAMEEALAKCFMAVYHNYQCEGMEQPGTVIFILSPSLVEDFQLWIAEKDDLSDLCLVDQGDSVRS